jgi:hypothetical protein
MKIQYSIGVKVDAGWRQVSIVANAELISTKMAKVTQVLTIDGETPNYNQSCTGAKRQSFNGLWWAKGEIGKTKRISACDVLENAE